MNLLNTLAKHFSIGGYDATDSRGRRRPPPTHTASEDTHADARKRLILSASARDLYRNWSLAGWMIRKHLDFVTDFSFKASTSDPGYNRELEAWWTEASKAHNFDVAARHSHRRAVRIAEACRVIDGDVFLLKLVGGVNRGKIQFIEGDRIAMPSVPPNSDPADWVNGVRVDRRTGRALAYGICSRNGSRKELERIVSARSIIPHAAYEFRFDQVRGISPITSALNQLRDVYESIDYELAKLKICSLFGLQVMTDPGGTGSFAGTATYTQDSDGDGVADSAPRVDLFKGPFITELDPGEKMEVLESRTPSSETVAFMQLLMQLSLRSLDLPFSFLSEDFTNFFGSRAALIHYLLSCDSKIADLQAMQDAHFQWRVGLAIEDGELELPTSREFDFIKWQFLPGGLEWWNPVEEARGQAMAIAMGVKSPQQVCRELGTDFERNIDAIAEAMQYAASKGVPITFADSSAFAPEITIGAANE